MHSRRMEFSTAVYFMVGLDCDTPIIEALLNTYPIPRWLPEIMQFATKHGWTCASRGWKEISGSNGDAKEVLFKKGKWRATILCVNGGNVEFKFRHGIDHRTEEYFSYLRKDGLFSHSRYAILPHHAFARKIELWLPHLRTHFEHLGVQNLQEHTTRIV